MFKSFFPKPVLFFTSYIVFSAIAVALWYGFSDQVAVALNIPKSEEAVIGLGHFIRPSFLMLYGYYIICVAVFAGFWFTYSPHKWQLWSIIGSAIILLSTHFSVQVSVAINNWRRPFFDAVQNTLSTGDDVVKSTTGDFYELIWIFAQIAFLAIFVFVFTRFLVSHWIFRWRTAMNDYYVSKWKGVRHIEGASQRVQEDTMRFSSIMEGLGVAIIDSIMTLFAFLPILWGLSSYVTELPLLGAIPAPLFNAAIFWSLFGTVLLAAVGIKLPGLEFKNQRVEAAYRKELVYGEDNEARAEPLTLKELFANVRKNYFRLYFHYMYFNVARSLYLQADNIFAYLILIPTIVAAKITFGILQQILTAFSQVSNSFQYLVNSWTTIVELLSVYKRLKSFEAAIENKPLVDLDQEYSKEV